LKNIAMIADFFTQQNSTFFSCSSIQRSLISHYSCWMIQQFFSSFFCWECEIHLGKDKENIGSENCRFW
jgi:hypothetical protein